MPDLNAPPRLLVIDAATDTLHLALQAGAHTAQRALPGCAQASSSLLPALQALLDEAGIAAASLDAIGFGRGPGAFTGVRTACAVAQGLAFGLDKPVLGLDSLLAVAVAAWPAGAGPAPGELAWVAVDARMNECYAAAYRRAADGGWLPVEPPGLHAPAALAARCVAAGPVWIAGNSLEVHAEAWGALAAGPQAVPQARLDGLALLNLARAAWAAGLAVDAALALPLYVRDKVAQTTAEREAARAAPAPSAA
ncbi:tRNA (adenosine(37)-N6)-threonylcarbamoyltransferase complex dimerization subunit type 1 TsaB [Piscinibacter sp. Jin2]|uniref:tRNA (Adenosine(37)-N6)-threonylcarbamoyltransferase complex dimerization subunit type 1 TsaB n=1 Tax=Aquariibacter lacus TaxID=2801332 RepID=A0A9X0XCB2_9BURK|nr:tRNA (adenosine(37)-N6)-threonylcarbamoyltransferase complex dimerization subunit type 1 TsaB [Piscinibacter lacus]MBL0718929.1 tRNA (adenosine(37)-N6)-threonylcarbamoyltransferase complex dimerization subunit type 1 TsaB [Piscinibacter lacus]